MNVHMYGTVKKTHQFICITNLYVCTGNAYDVISHRRLSGPRAPPIFRTSLRLCMEHLFRASSASRSDLQFIKKLQSYHDIDSKIAESAVKAIMNHLFIHSFILNISIALLQGDSRFQHGQKGKFLDERKRS